MKSSYDVEMMRLALDASPSGMLVVDNEGVVRLANREIEVLFGYPREELVGTSVERLLPIGLRKAHAKARLDMARASGERAMGAGRLVRGVTRDGRELPLEVGLRTVRTDRGTLVLAAVVDVRKRLLLEAELRQAQKFEAVGTLAGGVAHDFNNLLLAIVGYTELAQQAQPPNDEARAHLQLVLDAAARGRDLVRRLLVFSRRSEPSDEAVATAEVIEEGLALLRASLPKSLALQSRVDQETPAVCVDASGLQQVLMNLVSNAAHAVQRTGGRIEVTLRPHLTDEAFLAGHPRLAPGLYAHLRVADDGVGMTPEVLRHCREPFFTTKDVDEGTGLGLAVSDALVEGLGGALDLASEPGRGTSIDVYLPAAAYVAAATADSVTQPPTDVGPSPRILLVEDEEVLARLGARQLGDLGFEVTMHTSSSEALEDFRRRPDAFDLVVTDNAMPNITGLELTQAILRLRPRMPVLMVSGIGSTMDPGAVLAAGVRHLLPKPYTALELEHAVRLALVEDA